MTAWSAWFPDLLPHLPGCPTPIVEHELKRAAQWFFKHSRAWRVLTDPVAVAAGPGDVEIIPDDPQQELVRVEEAWLDGRELAPKTVEQLAEEGDGWLERTGTPSAFWHDTPEVVRLFPRPQAAATTGLVCRIAVKPSEAATGLPDDVARKYRDEILTGAKSYLMLYRDRAWTNLDMGAALGATFANMKDAALLNATRGYGRGRISSRPRWC